MKRIQHAGIWSWRATGSAVRSGCTTGWQKSRTTPRFSPTTWQMLAGIEWPWLSARLSWCFMWTAAGGQDGDIIFIRLYQAFFGTYKTDLIIFSPRLRIYERTVQTPSLDIPAGTSVWLGQRNNVHGFFKVWTALISALYDLYSVKLCQANKMSHFDAPWKLVCSFLYEAVIKAASVKLLTLMNSWLLDLWRIIISVTLCVSIFIFLDVYFAVLGCDAGGSVGVHASRIHLTVSRSQPQWVPFTAKYPFIVPVP